MARSDLVIDLVEAQQRGDENRFRMLVEAIIAEERSNQHHLVADRLSELITRSGARGLLTRDDSARHIADLVQEIVPKRRLVDVQMAAPVASAITEVVEEHRRSELLRSHGLEPRNRILLEGPPGNGKTSLAEAVAAELMVPFYVVRYEGVVSASSVRQPVDSITSSSLRVPAGVTFPRSTCWRSVASGNYRWG